MKQAQLITDLVNHRIFVEFDKGDGPVTMGIKVGGLISRIIPSDAISLPNGDSIFDSPEKLTPYLLCHEWIHQWQFKRYGKIEGTSMYLLRLPFGGIHANNSMEKQAKEEGLKLWIYFKDVAESLKNMGIGKNGLGR